MTRFQHHLKGWDYVSDPTITYYGERGIVNGIILDIKDDIEKQKKFLKAIKLADRSSLPWVDDAAHFNWFIEPLLSQFGNPDVILTVETNTKMKYAFFIEAKIKNYDKSAYLLNKNMTLDKYDNGAASKINVQLAFKYRFVEALLGDLNSSVNIEESGEVAEQYKDKPRKLKLTTLCDHIKDKLFKDITKENIYYIALTNDKKSLEPFKNEDTLPPITRPNWEKDKNKFGLLTYESLEFMGVINSESGVYGQAAQFMFRTLTEAELTYYISEEVISNKNFQNWTPEQMLLADHAKKVVDDTLRKLQLDTSIIYKKNEGSYSYEDKRSNGKIVLKIQLYKNSKDKHNEEHIVIGIRKDEFSDKLKDNTERHCYSLGGGNKKQFWCYPAEKENDRDKLSKVIEEYLNARMA